MGINKESNTEDLANQSKKTRRKRGSLKVNLTQCNCSESSENEPRAVDVRSDLCENPVLHRANSCKISKKSEDNLLKGRKLPRTKKSAHSNASNASEEESKLTLCKNTTRDGTKAKKSCSTIPDVNNDKVVTCRENNSIKNDGKSGKKNIAISKDSLLSESTGSLPIVALTGKHSQIDNSLSNNGGSILNKSTQISEVESNYIETTSDFIKLSKSKRRRIRKKRSLAALSLKNCSEDKLKEPEEGDFNTALKSGHPSKSLLVADLLSEDLVKSAETNAPAIHRANRKKDLSPFYNKPSCVSELPKGGELHRGCGKLFESPSSLGVINSSSNDSLCCEIPNVKGNACLVTGNNSKDEEIPLENLGYACGSVKHSVESHTNVSRKEDNFSEKVNLPNFLSHDNVEGLFRSALLNDITLSSRCSEKEVKNFFNTYGTFSEKNRSQFAEVEKLLSSNKVEGSSNSLFFGSERKESCSGGNTSDSWSCIPPLRFPANIGDLTETVANNSSGEGAFEYNNSSGNVSTGTISTLSQATDVKKVERDPICGSLNAENIVIDSLSNSESFREVKAAVPSLSSSIHSSRIIPEKSESRLLEIVENVLLVHERVRELNCEKKSQKGGINLPNSNSFAPSDSREYPEKLSSKTGNINIDSLKYDSSVFETSQSESMFKVDSASKKKSPLCESISPTLLSESSSGNSEECVTKINKMQKTDKSKDEIKAEREAKKQAKLARKQKAAGVAGDSSANVACGGDAVTIKRTDGNKQLDTSTHEDKKLVQPVSKKGVSHDKRVDSKVELPSSVTHTEVANDSSSTVEEGQSKSKAELKAERRAKQEAQRAAKLLQQPESTGTQRSNEAQSSKSQTRPLAPKEAEDESKKVKLTKDKDSGKEVIKSAPVHKVKLFNHLYVKQEASVPKSIFATSNMHPAIVRLGVQYATKIVVGSNARCLALLSAVKQVIEDYKTPPQQEFSRGLGAVLQLCMSFLQECRPLSVSMTNAVKYLKWILRKLSNNISDVDAKKKLQEAIDTYIREQIEVAGQAICNTVIEKISSGDVILTYGCSSLLQRILIKAHKNGTKFKVIIVDARPWREGKEMLRRLVENGLSCSYVIITATSFVMREATKVFLGAHALLANGYVMSRAGSSQVALLAHSYNVPVLVCCETHKFSERVQTDSIVYNELGAPGELVITDLCTKDHPLSKWKTVNNLTPLNLTYDVTPPDLVTAVVTELAILPCTSVPVILRIKPTEIGY